MSTSPETGAPLDQEKVEEVRQWLLKAQRDLIVADRATDGQPPILEAAVFHAQQAAEKTLKAFLTWHDIIFRRTHNLVERLRSRQRERL